MKEKAVHLILYTWFIEWVSRNLTDSIDRLRHPDPYQEETSQVAAVIQVVMLLAVAYLAARRFSRRSALAVMALLLRHKIVATQSSQT